MHGSLKVSGNWLSAVWPDNGTTWIADDRDNSQVKLWVRYPGEDSRYAAILTTGPGGIWVAYPPNIPPLMFISVDGTDLPLDDALIVPPRAYLLIGEDETIRFVSEGIVPEILYGKRFPWTQVEDLADQDGDVYEAVAALQGFRPRNSLTPLQGALLGCYKQMGWGRND